MKKDNNDIFPQEDTMVDGASRPKVRKKSSSLSNNIPNTSEHGTNNENRDIPSTDVPNMPTPNSDDFNDNLAKTSSYDINDEGVSSENSKNNSTENNSSNEDNESSNDVDDLSDETNNDVEKADNEETGTSSTNIEENDNSEESSNDDCADCDNSTDSDDDDCDINDCYYDNYSSSCNLDLAVLNEISKACQTAMNNISYLVKSICNSNMKKELVSMYSQYSNILFQTNQHFEKYGEVPDCVSIGCKLMGFCGIKMNTLKNKSNSHVADIMIQGTLMGVIKCQKILNCQLNIDQSTTNILKDFNQFQRDNIDKLNAYL